jgi:indolepyruvate ferredoxin oxidoreductase alpha subunit
MVHDLEPGTTYLLMGNEAIARGAVEAGSTVATGYPGTPSTEIIETLSKTPPENMYVEWSINEKVALEVAAAASFAGLRSLCAMKQNGVNVASDFLLHLVLSGTRGGCILVSCDDPGAFSSMNEEDSRFFSKLLEIPLLEPSTFQQAKDVTKWAFELSEILGSIIMVRSVTRLSHASGNVVAGSCTIRAVQPRFEHDGENGTQGITCAPVVGNHALVHNKLEKARSLFEASQFNTWEGPETPEVLIITSGICGLYCREAVRELHVEERVSILSLTTTWPLPEMLVKKHLIRAQSVLFVEEILPFLEQEVKALSADMGKNIQFHGKSDGFIPSTGEISPEVVISALSRLMDVPYKTASLHVMAPFHIPDRTLTFCAGCPHRASFWSLHTALALEGREGFVCGDIGCYTMDIFSQFPTLKTIHSMGSGFGLASGFGQLYRFGMDQPVMAVCGDSTFFHAAIPALINAVHQESHATFVVLDNRGTAMTGFQPHPGLPVDARGMGRPAVDIEKLSRSIGARVTIVDPMNLEKTQNIILKLLKDSTNVNVLILREECALSTKKERKRLYVDEASCIGEHYGCSRFCTRVFSCPGLIWNAETHTAHIDEVVCTGCGICSQICPAGAIKQKEE